MRSVLIGDLYITKIMLYCLKIENKIMANMNIISYAWFLVRNCHNFYI